MYQVDISIEAGKDIDEHYLYIRERSPVDAERWYFDMFDKIQTLKEHPARCPVADESRFHDYEIKNLIIGNFRVIYRIQKDIVQILHVKRGSQERVPLPFL